MRCSKVDLRSGLVKLQMMQTEVCSKTGHSTHRMVSNMVKKAKTSKNKITPFPLRLPRDSASSSDHVFRDPF
ncbi:Histone-Lysine N-Methyltransferase 2A [Manis pentadactyla]|nr:Histone-Lysine N-Methyltransferase 2A [Manis pentadactyla]